MKKLKFLLLAITAGTIMSCGDDDVKSITDCLGENLLITIEHEKATDNPKKVTFEVQYFGELTLDGTIKWKFDDTTPTQTITGTTATHTYTTPGTYQATATISLKGGACVFDVKETVTIN